MVVKHPLVEHPLFVLVLVNIVSLIYVPLVFVVLPVALKASKGRQKDVRALIRSRPGRGHELSSSKSKRPRKPLATPPSRVLSPRVRRKSVASSTMNASFATPDPPKLFLRKQRSIATCSSVGRGERAKENRPTSSFATSAWDLTISG